MKHVTFLLGAGASKNALPIVNEISDRMDYVINELERNDYILPDNETYKELDKDISKRQLQLDLIKDFKWISNESRKHASIDTFAKKLLIKQKHVDLLRLKGILSVFFIFEQHRNPVDNRYDTFLASILQNSVSSLPPQVKIVSWNYDFQFEKAYSEYSGDLNIDSNSYSLNVISKFSRDPDKIERFSIFKLNGTTNMRDRVGFKTYSFHDNSDYTINIGFIDQLVMNYTALLRLSNNVFPNLSFAWERHSSEADDYVNTTIKGIYKTNILVVIGYSFPFFNREIDRKIINSLEDLEKVYFQSPDADALQERFLSIRNDILPKNLISKYDTSQFFLPNEL